MRYSDAHGHFHVLESGDALPEECRRAVCCGTHPGDWEAVLDLARRDSRIVPALGLHPWFIGEVEGDWLGKLRNLLEKTPAGVGEIGLDRTRRSPSLDEQEPVLRAQLSLALEFGVPITLHCIGAWGRLLAVLEASVPPDAPVLLHGFSASDEMLPQFLQRSGTYFSFGIEARSSLLYAVPNERRVFESDAIAAAPRSRPANGALCAISHAASILNISEEELATTAEITIDRFLQVLPRS